MEQRNKILGEWDEEEDNEAEVEEKKKVKENLGETVDSDMSEIESDQEAYFQDDNINNYHGDDSDEEFFEDKNNKISDLIDKMESENDNDATTENEEKTADTSTEKNNGTTTETATIDVAKVLEETQVPELPDLDALSAPLPGSGGSSKKSVKFSAQVAKEFAITKMALVQPKSNMVGPMEVQDEFDFDDSDNLQSIPRFSKTILKKRSTSPPPPQSSSAVASSTSEVTSNVTSTETSEAEVAMSLQPHTSVTGVTSSEALVTSSEDTSTSEAAATMLALGQPQEAMASNDVNKEETYLLVVEDGQQLDQLNSQTFYIDSNSLANGDYSKMVLATSGGSVDQNSEPQAASKIDSTEVTAAAAME